MDAEPGVGRAQVEHALAVLRRTVIYLRRHEAGQVILMIECDCGGKR